MEQEQQQNWEQMYRIGFLCTCYVVCMLHTFTHADFFRRVVRQRATDEGERYGQQFWKQLRLKSTVPPSHGPHCNEPAISTTIGKNELVFSAHVNTEHSRALRDL